MLRGLVNMLRLLSKFFLTLLIVTSFGFGEDFERVCDEEVLKEDFNISIVKSYCKKAGDHANNIMYPEKNRGKNS